MKILVALDHSQSSQDVLEFTKRMFGQTQPENLQLVLFHVVESLPEFTFTPVKNQQSEETINAAQAAWDSVNEAAGHELVTESKTNLIESGIPESCISSRLCTRESLPKARKTVAALAIIEEMQSGEYEIICIGRRGTTDYDSVFLGSTAEKILRESRGKTVWVVDA